MDNHQMGQFLCALRKSQGLTQQQLGDKLCVTGKAISKWECGDGYPEITTLPTLSNILGVTVDELLQGRHHAHTHPAAVPGHTDLPKHKLPIQHLCRQNRLFFAVGIGFVLFGFFLCGWSTFIQMPAIFASAMFHLCSAAGLTLFFTKSNGALRWLHQNLDLPKARASHGTIILRRYGLIALWQLLFWLSIPLKQCYISIAMAPPKINFTIFAPYFLIGLCAFLAIVLLGLLTCKKDPNRALLTLEWSVIWACFAAIIMCICVVVLATNQSITHKHLRTYSYTYDTQYKDFINHYKLYEKNRAPKDFSSDPEWAQYDRDFFDRVQSYDDQKLLIYYLDQPISKWPITLMWIAAIAAVFVLGAAFYRQRNKEVLQGW